MINRIKHILIMEIFSVLFNMRPKNVYLTLDRIDDIYNMFTIWESLTN
jgi:hypothetical protein